MTDNELINGLCSLALDLLHTNTLVLEGYCAATDQKLYMNEKSLEALKFVAKKYNFEEKEKLEGDSPSVMIRDFQFSINITS